MAFGIAVQGQIFFQVVGSESGEPVFRQAAETTLLYPIAVLSGLSALVALRWSWIRRPHQ